MLEDTWGNDASRGCSLPTLNSFTFRCEADRQEDTPMRRLPPLPPVEPLPPGPFNNPFTLSSHVQSPPSSQDTFPTSLKSSGWHGGEHKYTTISPPSPVSSVDFSLKETFSTQKAFGWPNDLSYSEIMALVQPRNINRKPPLQQLCGRKRKNDTMTSSASDQDDQREKHRIAEGNRRKNLSQLHRELDNRLHDFFLERAGWNPSKSLPQSKEHIVQGAIYLIDFLLAIVVFLMGQEKNIPPQLSENLQGQLRSMQLQQLVSSLQSQNQAMQYQIRALKQEYDDLLDRHRALEFKLKSYDQVFRSPKPEVVTPLPMTTIPHGASAPGTASANQQEKKTLLGLRVLCSEIPGMSPDCSFSSETSNTTNSTSSSSNLDVIPRAIMSPMTTRPSSPMCLTPSSSFSHSSLPSSRRESLNHTL
ncbi:HLH DNA binding domain protein, putative [Talaromyces stipitatus ATCC 10500]|uniref:HLH DNA binding domain protein, putative n=1 Tax=Talaromyces stipitatus (strain ATCC 10500 / CBS 375.48 / QM 6759 / NRRL 1006) TaxID=441959 RepID=B8LTS8_TALSN|nr:HLH DNA binding domain protein, putative [Talaromyces stipitatus ATCC 10500]EED23670.1 HLH DNA binding domain protein, putative [Talaromyces stipitatus ATCC 10500]